MPTTLSTSDVVVLKGGLAVPLEVLQLAWRLEDAGVVMELGTEGSLRAGPGEKLSETDRAAIRQHKPALLALVQYVDEVIA